MRRGKGMRLIALLSVLCMVITLIPTKAFAAVPTGTNDWFVEEDTEVRDNQSFDFVCVESGYTLSVVSGGCLTIKEDVWLDGGSLTVEEGASFQAKSIDIEATVEQPVVVSGSGLTLFYVNENDQVVEYPKDDETGQYLFINSEFFYYAIEDENPAKNNKWILRGQYVSRPWFINSNNEVLNEESEPKICDYVMIEQGHSLTIEAGGKLHAGRIYLDNGTLIIKDGADFYAEDIEIILRDGHQSTISGLTLWSIDWEGKNVEIADDDFDGLGRAGDTYTFSDRSFQFSFDTVDDNNKWMLSEVGWSIYEQLQNAWMYDNKWGVESQAGALHTGTTLVDAEKQQLIDFLWEDVQNRENGKFSGIFQNRAELEAAIEFPEDLSSFLLFDEGKTRWGIFTIMISNLDAEIPSVYGMVFALPKNYILVDVLIEGLSEDFFLWDYTNPTPVYQQFTDPRYYEVVGAYSHYATIEDGVGIIRIQGQLVENPTEIRIHDSIQWTLSENRVLTIFGKGNMKNYGADNPMVAPPWMQYAEDINAIVVDEGITRIGTDSFYGLDKLESVTLSEGLKEIDEFAFGGCTSLSELHFPASLEWIDPFAFLGSGITAFEVSDSDYFATRDGVLYDAKMERLVLWPEAKSASSFTIPQGVKVIDDFALPLSDIKEVILPEGLVTIGEVAFHSSQLETIFIPRSVSEIAESAFGGLQEQLVIKGYRNSFAHRYADENGFRFVAIDPVIPSYEPFVPEPSAPESEDKGEAIVDGDTAVVRPEATVTDGTAEVDFDNKQLESLLDELMNADEDTEPENMGSTDDKDTDTEAGKPKGTLEIAPKVESGVDRLAVKLPGEALNKLGSETGIDVSIKTENGGMQLPNETVGVLNEQADGEDLKIEISKVEKEKQKEELANLLNSQTLLKELVEEQNRQAQEDTDNPDSTAATTETINPVGALKIEISAGTQSLTRFGNAMLTVSIPVVTNKLLPKYPLVLAIDSSGKVHYMKGTRTGSNVAVGTNHLTTFIVTDLDYKEHVDALKNISFLDPKTVIATGSKVDFEIEVSGYELDDLTWYTARRNRATVGKNKGKLVATVTGKTAGEDTLIIKSKGKVVAELQITVERAFANFVNSVKTMKVGEKLSFELNVTGYDKKDILWYTKRRNRAVVGKNAGKTEAVVTAKTVGTDTLYVVVDGKIVAETTIKVEK